MLLWATKKGWACDELPPMALAAGTFFFRTGADEGSKVTTGFSYPKGIYTSISFGGKIPVWNLWNQILFWCCWHNGGIGIFLQVCMKKRKYDGIEKLSDRQTFQISKASRNAWALLARMGDEEWLVVVHLLTFHPQISSVSAPADYTIHDSRMVIISRIIWPNYRIC